MNIINMDLARHPGIPGWSAKKLVFPGEMEPAKKLKKVARQEAPCDWLNAQIRTGLTGKSREGGGSVARKISA